MTRVLYVDDALDAVEPLRLIFESEDDFEYVGHCVNADALAEEVERSRAQLVLLDLSMPGRDPLEAVRDVRTRCPETRVVIFSGYDDPDTAERARAAGASGLVAKATDVGVMLDRLRQIVRGESLSS